MITISDQTYSQWINQLSSRYRKSQIKAAIKVNREMLIFYWSLGRDIVNTKAEQQWGTKFLQNLSKDLKCAMPDATCFSETNLKYMKYFYEMYEDFCPQLEDNSNEKRPQAGDKLKIDIFSLPWGHHKLLIDKLKNNTDAAFFYIRKTLENGWSRDVLLNYLSTDLYKREGKALSNFNSTLPLETSDLAQELTRDPYSFAFTGLTGTFNEKVLKEALLNNITQFLLELGTGFAYIGKEYKLQIDVKEKYIDLLFYNLNLSCYVVVEVKIGEFDFQDIGQLQGYVVAVNHLLRKEERDNPTIGIIICKSKNNTLAQYALEGSNLPIAISEYDLQRLYPTEVEGTIPTIAQIEDAINKSLNKDKP